MAEQNTVTWHDEAKCLEERLNVVRRELRSEKAHANRQSARAVRAEAEAERLIERLQARANAFWKQQVQSLHARLVDAERRASAVDAERRPSHHPSCICGRCY